MSYFISFKIQYDAVFSHENRSQYNIVSVDVHDVEIVVRIDVPIFNTRLRAIVNL